MSMLRITQYIAICHIFPHYLIKGATFEQKKKLFHVKCVFLLSPQLLSEIFIFLRRCEAGFGGLEVACWPLVPKFAGSNPAEAVGFFRAKKSSARLPSEGK